MNILIVSDDGLNAYGLKLLEQAVAAWAPNARTTTLATKNPVAGTSLAVTPKPTRDLERTERGSNRWEVHGRPCDLIYLAGDSSEFFLPNGFWDLVVSGANHGHNVGMDTYHSGTVGMAMLAALHYWIPAIAFSVEMAEFKPDGTLEEAQRFGDAGKFIRLVLQGTRLVPGECVSVNLPKGPPKGWQQTIVADNSRFYPRRAGCPVRTEGLGVPTDMEALTAGYITLSTLDLRVNPVR